MRDGGKGDRKRPLVIPEEQFNKNWDSIFGKQKTIKDFVEEAMTEEYQKVSEQNDNRD